MPQTRVVISRATRTRNGPHKKKKCGCARVRDYFSACSVDAAGYCTAVCGAGAIAAGLAPGQTPTWCSVVVGKPLHARNDESGGVELEEPSL